MYVPGPSARLALHAAPRVPGDPVAGRGRTVHRHGGWVRRGDGGRCGPASGATAGRGPRPPGCGAQPWSTGPPGPASRCGGGPGPGAAPARDSTLRVAVFDLRHPRGKVSGSIGQAPAPYGRLAGLLGRVADAARLPPGGPEASPTVLVALTAVWQRWGGRTGIFREVQCGTGQAPGGLLAPALGRFPSQGCSNKGHLCR